MAASLGLTNLAATVEGRDATTRNNISAGTTLANANLTGFSGEAGSFKINNTEISFDESDTIENLLSKINSSGANVTASLDRDTRQITLTNNQAGASTIEVDAGGTGLANALGLGNLTATVEGRDAETLNNISEGTTLANANLDGFSGGAGSFKINNAEISFDGSDTIENLLSKINSSGANVTASLDQDTRQITLTNNQTGASTIDVEAGSTGLANALGLRNLDSTVVGTDTQITANGKTFTTSSNTIDGSKFGFSGVQVDVSKLSAGGSASVTLNAEVKGETIVDVKVESVTDAVTDFFDQFNKVQAFLETNSEAGGKVFGDISRGLRGSVSQIFSNSALSGGISGSGSSNQVTINANALDKGIANGNQSVLSLFGDSGFAAKTSQFISGITGSTGTLARETSRNEKAEAQISNRLDDLSNKEETNRTRLKESLSSVSQALISINGQKNFLSGIGVESAGARASKTREGTTGLNLGGRLEAIQERASKAGIETGGNKELDLNSGIEGIQNFIKGLVE